MVLFCVVAQQIDATPNGSSEVLSPSPIWKSDATTLRVSEDAYVPEQLVYRRLPLLFIHGSPVRVTPPTWRLYRPPRLSTLFQSRWKNRSPRVRGNGRVLEGQDRIKADHKLSGDNLAPNGRRSAIRHDFCVPNHKNDSKFSPRGRTS